MAQGAPIAVLGAGSWGTALARLLAGNGSATRLWGHDPGHMAALARERENREFLPGHPLPDSLDLAADLSATLDGVRDVLVVVPSHAFRGVLEAARPALPTGARVAWATKGLEPGSAQPLHRVAREVLGPERPLAVVSGPTFAREVAAELPTAVVVAADDPAFAQDLAARLHNGFFRVYVGGDLVGVELGGAVKNVLAIAAGIADGLGFGANTRAALITRGLAEMTRLGVAAGGEADTFMGLAGLGDLVLTCTDDLSRNRRYGLALARGETPAAAEAGIGQVVEGASSARVVMALARELAVEMPITEHVLRVIAGEQGPRQAVASLLARSDARAE